MNARQRRIVIVAAICVVAISLAAATLDSTVELSGGGGSGEGPAPPAQPDAEPPEHSGGAAGLPCIAWLASPWVGLGMLAALGGAAALLYRRYAAFEAVAFSAALAIPGLVLYALFTACATGEIRRTLLERLARLSGLFPAGETASGTDPVVPAVVLGVILLVGLLIAAIFLHISLSGSGSAPPTERQADDADGAAAARAAGEAADRLEEGSELSTEIHRAWRDMAAHLDVARPDTSTPGEFATAAIESGLDPDAVRELTTLFEEVRYGGVEATADRKARARRALTRIEARHETAADSADSADERDEYDDRATGGTDE
jgi:hypothetical protein